ncbi:hypothetical protein [Streptomyces iconiensis]|uniref:Lipoprotein n=1 Tax=Streptomyces iconiensis TaxID=1384038 RepID=A0ABT7A213_9ACTN|nr:hypothetical protein [Streptomyces iconiensis]MDJ1135383.1 hypothetical protein [Streptomyces iconiensis]
MGADRRGGTGRSGRALCAALALTVLAGLSACGGADGEGPEDAVLQGVLARQAVAVRKGDERGYLAETDPRATRYRTEQRRVFRNLRLLPLSEWSYEVREVAGAEDGGRATAEVALRYRLAGYDRVTTTATERLGFVRREGRWYVASEREGSARQLWEQGEMRVVRGEHSLVMGVGRSRPALRALARTADKAVPAVEAAWPRKWSRKLVLEAPASLTAMGGLLKSPASSYEGIAAVTTGEADGNGRAETPADRIVVNPGAYGMLSGTGRQVVLTHEATHVATRDATTPATPMWLSEGIADWAGYRDADQPPRTAAPELTRAVTGEAKGGQIAALRALPSDAQFRFGSDPEKLARAYEGGWLACRMIAEQWGEDKLVALYARAGDEGEARRQDTGAALDAVLGIGEKEFTERWRAYVVRELKDSGSGS